MVCKTPKHVISLTNQISNPVHPGRAGRVRWFCADLQLLFRCLSHYITGRTAPSGGTTCKHFLTWLTRLLVSLHRVEGTKSDCGARNQSLDVRSTTLLVRQYVGSRCA
jgi:hypothetical protein